MRFSAVASIVSFAVSALAQDKVGDSGDDLGRCHVYYVGDYGACGVQATTTDVNGPCGDSASNPCISTSNGNLCPSNNSLCNCGTCYKLTMTYSDSHQTTAYIVAQDTNGSETRYEMGQQAWALLCPYVCNGTGVCAYKESECAPYGIIPQPPLQTYPESCAVQNAAIHWEVVECGGSSPVDPTSSPTLQPPTVQPPTQAPTGHPPTVHPPTRAPTQYPTAQPPTHIPTQAPTAAPGGSCYVPNAGDATATSCYECVNFANGVCSDASCPHCYCSDSLDWCCAYYSSIFNVAYNNSPNQVDKCAQAGGQPTPIPMVDEAWPTSGDCYVYLNSAGSCGLASQTMSGSAYQGIASDNTVQQCASSVEQCCANGRIWTLPSSALYNNVNWNSQCISNSA